MVKNVRNSYEKLRNAGIYNLAANITGFEDAYNTATEKFMTLERRFGMEAQLVIDTAAGKDTSNYKTVI